MDYNYWKSAKEYYEYYEDIISFDLFEEIFNRGYNDGYAVGEDEGHNKGYDTGYNDGCDIGYNEGYDNGYRDATEEFQEEN